MRNRIIRFFPGSDLRKGHIGLAKLARRKGIDPQNLKLGEYLIFMNNRKDKIKLFASNNIIAYLRLPQGEYISLDTIREIPNYFNGKSINYKGAIAKSISDSLARRSW